MNDSRETNYWKIGEVYVVASPNGGVMGKLIEFNENELIFKRIGHSPVIEALDGKGTLYAGDGRVIISRMMISSAERFTP